MIVASLTPKGWELYDKVMQFGPENLYEQINGRAEYYLAYDVIGMTFASFDKSTDNTIFINLSIYDMGTPTNAFGVFAGERPLEAPRLKLGRDGLSVHLANAKPKACVVVCRFGEQKRVIFHATGTGRWGIGVLGQSKLTPT